MSDVSVEAVPTRPEIGPNCDVWPEEVWDGVPFMPPFPDTEHAGLSLRLCVAIQMILGYDAPSHIRGACNLSDRGEGWLENYRFPDGAVFHPGNSAINHDTHWEGGPDFLLEILSDGDRAMEKLPFYARIGTREILMVDRAPWRLELYHTLNRVQQLAGTSTVAEPALLWSRTLPMALRLVVGTGRPQIEVRDTITGQVWLV